MTVLVSRDELPPRFVGSPFAFEVSENAAVNSSVGVVSATDDDLKERLVFDVISLPPASDFFRVSDEGVVEVKAALNMRSTTSYSVTMTPFLCHLTYIRILVFNFFFS